MWFIEHVAPAGHDVHELGQVGAAAQVRAVGPDDEDLDVVVDVGLADEVGVAVLGVDRHGVELVGAVERDGGDLGGRVLLVEDDLLSRWALVRSSVMRALFCRWVWRRDSIRPARSKSRTLPVVVERNVGVGDEHDAPRDLEAGDVVAQRGP